MARHPRAQQRRGRAPPRPDTTDGTVLTRAGGKQRQVLGAEAPASGAGSRPPSVDQLPDRGRRHISGAGVHRQMHRNGGATGRLLGSPRSLVSVHLRARTHSPQPSSRQPGPGLRPPRAGQFVGATPRHQGLLAMLGPARVLASVPTSKSSESITLWSEFRLTVMIRVWVCACPLPTWVCGGSGAC